MDAFYFGPNREEERRQNYCLSAGYMYVHTLNECLHNHPSDSMQERLEEAGITLAANLNGFWFCLTGIKKDVYWDVYKLDANNYLKIYNPLRQRLLAEVAQHGWSADIFLVTKEDEKQFGILMSPNNETDSGAEDVATRLGQIVQNAYEEAIFKGDHRYCNVTALSEELSGFDDIRAGYSQARALNDLSFFRMEPVVMTRESVAASCNGADYPMVMEVCVQLALAVDEGDAPQANHCLKELFLQVLRGSYSLSLCRDALSFLKNMLQVRCTVYEQIEGLNLEQLCRVESYLKIEECVSALSPVLAELCGAVRAKGSYSRAVIQAIYYIKNHYKTDLALPEIARHANINPSYLSSTFKQNTGLALRDYITQVRIQAAKGLLLEERTVDKVAETVGIYDAKYFARTFKRLTGQTPAEYRKERQR